MFPTTYGYDTSRGLLTYIQDANDDKVCYTYDARGRVISTDGSMAYTLGYENPFRYRSYYFDVETGFYYLQSRYYDPIVGRWLNPEPNVYAGGFDEGAGLLGYNVYAYCANNPVMFKDETGESITLAIWIGIGIGALLGGLGGWAYAKHFNIPKGNRWIYILGGALIGGIIGGCTGYALSAGSGAVLWSGKGMGKAAAEFARQNGLKVLEQTLRGKLLSSLAKVLPYKVMRQLWEAASARFLMSYARKQAFVHVFITAEAYANMKSVFNSVEMQVVADLGLKIIWHFVK